MTPVIASLVWSSLLASTTVTASTAVASTPSSNVLYTVGMLAEDRIREDDQRAERKTEHAANCGSPLDVSRFQPDENGVDATNKAADGDQGGQESRGQACPFENRSCENEDRRHTASVAGRDARVARRM
jgi:hypothetical protein